MKKSELKYVPLSDIKIGSRFRKDYGDIAELAEDLASRGMVQSITIDQDMNLLAGGRRCKAAEMAGFESVPAIIREVEDKADAMEIELVENVLRKDLTWQERTANIAAIDTLYRDKKGESWSGRKTAALIGKSVGGVNKALQLSEALDIIPELKKCKTEDDAFKLYKKLQENVVVQEMRREQDKKIGRGHADHLKYAADHYRVQDAFEGLKELIELQKELGSKTPIKLVEVDPPYGIDLNEVKKGDDKHEHYEEVSKEDYPAFLKTLCNLLYECTPRDVWLIFWYGPTWHTEVKSSILNAGFKCDDIPAIWAKTRGQTNAPDRYLARSYEPFFIAWKGCPPLHNRGRSNVFTHNSVSGARKFHPTQRPVELMEDILDTFCYPGAIVLVPFLGSGVTLRSAYRKDMTGFGWDLSKRNKDRFLLTIDEDKK